MSDPGSDGTSDGEPDLGALADRLGSEQAAEPVAFHLVRSTGGHWLLLATVVGVLTLLALASVVLESYDVFTPWVWLGVLVLSVPLAAYLPGLWGLAEIDDDGITLTAGPPEGRGRYQWRHLVEVGLTPAPGWRGLHLVVRPAQEMHGGVGPFKPAVLPVPAYGEAARSELRDVLAHVAERHRLVLTTDGAATGALPPSEREE